MSFASRLKELREREGLSLRDLQAESGYHRNSIHRIEIGGYPDSVDRILDIADALDLTDKETNELVARRMSERYDCGECWETWGLPAAIVVEGVKGVEG